MKSAIKTEGKPKSVAFSEIISEKVISNPTLKNKPKR
jgi:hypothetical protein